jgi:hypothetical protein
MAEILLMLEIALVNIVGNGRSVQIGIDHKKRVTYGRGEGNYVFFILGF